MDDPMALRALWLSYRLGELPDEERARIDERILADADFADALEEAEFDLIDDFVAARLAPAERSRAQRALRGAFVARVTLARGMRGAPATPRTTERDPPTRDARFALARIARVAIAACVFAAFALWLVRRDTGIDGVRGASAPRVADATVRLWLPDGTARGGVGVRLVLAPQTRSVLVQWRPAHPAADRYVLTVTRADPRGFPPIRVDGTSTRVEGDRIVVFALPANRLARAPVPVTFSFSIARATQPGVSLTTQPVLVGGR